MSHWDLQTVVHHNSRVILQMIEDHMERKAIAAAGVLRLAMHRIVLLVCSSLIHVAECIFIGVQLDLDDATIDSSCNFFNFMFRTILIVIKHSMVVRVCDAESNKFGKVRTSLLFGVTELLTGSNENITEGSCRG